MNKVYLSLGSNIGNRLDFLRSAIGVLSKHNFIKLIEISSVYETSPVDMRHSRNFYNLVIFISTNLNPFNLLDSLKDIEKEIGRKKGHNLSREIDIDIISYEELVIDSDELTIPHKLAKKRKFVLEPLKELNNNFKFPGDESTVSDLLVDIKSNDMCNKINSKPLKNTINV